MKRTLLKNLDMEKQELKNKIEGVVNQIKTNSKDAKFADSLIDKLLSLKGQLDVEPMRFVIPEKDVIKEYDNDSIRFVRCKGYIAFQAKGGFYVFVSPRMSALYQHLEGLLDMKDNFDNLTEEQKEGYDTSYLYTSILMQTMLFAVFDAKMFSDLSSDVMNRYKEFLDRYKNIPLQEETHKENAEFENNMELANQVLLGDKNDRTVG